MLELLHRLVKALPARRFRDLVDSLSLDEHHERQGSGVTFACDRPDLEVDASGLTFHGQEMCDAQRGLFMVEGAMQGRSQVEAKLVPHEVHHIRRQRTPGWLKEPTGALGQVDCPVAIIDKDARRSHTLQHTAMDGSVTGARPE